MNQEEFLNRIITAEELPTIKRERILVALSGGADSVALLRGLMAAGCDCHAAHCNFHLRGEESMRDERFVRDLCKRLGVPLSVKDFDVAAWQQEHGGSVEMACRELRYAWFEQEMERLGCTLIAVAHHADDQAETFFLNLLRGTGLKGLAGMQRNNGRIWRPLLNVTRAQVLEYLDSIGQDYVTDSTNAENDYRRNRVRNLVLPVIGQQFPHAHQRILDTMSNLRDDHDLLTSLVKQVLPDERHIDNALLCSYPNASTLLYHRIRHLGFNRDQCEQAVLAVQQGHSGRQFVANRYAMHVNRQSLDIEPMQDGSPITIPIDLLSDIQSPVHVSVSHNNAPFTPMMCDGKFKVAFNTNLLDCQHIVLRHWQKGDRIKPFGMNGSKLVSDMFVDLKLDHCDKRDIWLLEADGNILWILGHRASAHYPVAPDSQDYIMLVFQKTGKKFA